MEPAASIPFSPAYWPPLRYAMLCQAAIGLFLLIPYHMELVFLLWLFAAVAFWLGIAFMLFRRPVNPTAMDIHFARWGFLAFFVVVGPFFVWLFLGN